MLTGELKAMARLAAPIVLAELGWMAMGIVDTMVVGRVSADAIAAVGLGAIVFYGIGMCASGVLLGMDTLVAQSFGAGDREDSRKSLVNGVWLSIVLIPPVMALVRAFDPLLAAFGVDKEILVLARPYVHALNWSAPPLLLYFAIRRYLQAVHIVQPVMWTLLTANFVNLAANWVLVFGHLGAPRMGAEGSGWATCLSRVYMAVVLGIVLWRRESDAGKISWRPDAARIAELLKLGLPAAGQMGVEIAVFAVVTILIGRLNALALAGNQIALTTVSTTFMMPLGISSAAAVRVGNALGRRDPEGAARSGWTALGLAVGVMSVAAVTLLVAPHMIARLFTPEAEAIAAAVTLLRIAAFFQLFDGLQVVATGALRGAGDTRTPMLCHFTGYWLIGLPLGAELCFGRGFGAAGLWTGLCAGLILIGSVLALLWRRTSRNFEMIK
ncbi:MAG: MATE family efflux transporter [Bryobacterales bacterium]|nr:MATE family efflux transporter [Bryobacterales bacterium]MBV9400938.1 MATE family efflux transporter [Bryobacterales bacterium]